MSSNVWISAASGAWSAAAKWSLGRAPLSGDLVDIEPGAFLTVDFDVGNLALGGLVLSSAALDLEGGALTVTGATSFANATALGIKPLVLAGVNSIRSLTISGSATVCNKGVATQFNGDVNLSGAGAIRNLVGATWRISDASGMNQASASGWGFVNYGTFQKTSGSGFAIIRANFVSTGVIASQLNGDIVFEARANLSGTYVGAGMIDYGSTCLATLGTLDVTASTCQSNWGGVVNQIGDMTMHDGSTIMNGAGRWNFAGDSSIRLAAGEAAGPDFNGSGVIAKTAGTGVSHFGINVATEGVVTVAKGVLSFEGASSSFASAINGAGTFQIAGGRATLQSGTRLTVAHWTLAGGVTTLGENLSYAGAFAGVSGAAFDLGGHALTLTGDASLSGLSVVGSGVLALRATANVSGLTVGGTAALRVYGSVTQFGGNVTLGDENAADAAHLNIYAGGVWTLAGANSINAADPLSSLILYKSTTPGASGLLKKTGGGVSHVETAVVNSALNSAAGAFGGLEVDAGVLDLQGAVSGLGADHIVGPATLGFDSSVSTGQTVFFSGSGGKLVLNDLAEFHGVISGFDTVGSGDALFVAGGWSFTGASETTTATTLSLTHGAAHQTLTLLGDYTGGVFAAQTINGQLQITL